jgi:hypothetical protein
MVRRRYITCKITIEKKYSHCECHALNAIVKHSMACVIERKNACHDPSLTLAGIPQILIIHDEALSPLTV